MRKWFLRVRKLIIKFFFGMVSEVRRGFDLIGQKAKRAKMKRYTTAFTRLEGCSSGFKEGCG